MMPNRRFACYGIPLILVCCGMTPVHAATTAVQSEYRFTQINDFEKQGIPVGSTAINHRGDVAFTTWAFDFQLGDKYTMYAGRGGPVTRIADTTGPLAMPISWQPDINRYGAVAFKSHLDKPGFLEPWATGLYKGNGTALTTVARYDRGAFLTDAAMNDKGQVASVVTWQTGVSSVVTFSPNRTVATFSNPSNTFGEPDINNLGLIAYPTKTSTEERIVTAIDGKQLTRVTTKGSNLANLIAAEPRINDFGAIAFLSDLKTGGQGIFVADQRGLRMIADTSGPFQALGAPAINNRGEVIFTAQLGISEFGIFRGPNAITDRIIGPGDFLGGEFIASAHTSSRGLNDAGQIAFTATFASERTLICRADPVSGFTAIPEPSTLRLIGINLVVALLGLIRSRTTR